MRKILSFVSVLLLLVVAAWAQNSPISGQVRNETGEPVPFATVRIKGTNSAVSADQNGNYTISVPRGATLQVSAASFEMVEVNVGNESTVPVTLKSQSGLQEVVVTALGQTTSKARVGYSTTTFSNETI